MWGGAPGLATGRFAAFLVWAALFLSPLSFASPTHAANSTCSIDGATSTANCTDVPADGISYVDIGNVNEVDAGNVDPSTAVQSGITGILLRKNGVRGDSAANESARTEFSFKAEFDPDGDGEEPAWTILASDESGTPVLVEGNYIRVLGSHPNYSYEIRTSNIGDAPTHTFANEEALGNFLQDFDIGEGQAVSAGLTVVNHSNFSTTNANGIDVRSLGGRGGNGGCTNLLVASWCSSGKRGGNAGSVAVTNSGVITVTGDDRTGVTAISSGGSGGNGGGTFGIYSSAGGGGSGGDGGSVTVLLNGTSSIETFGARGYGVLASSVGGNGGRGGSSAGAAALGSNGGNGGSSGIVEVTNQGSITTNGDDAHAIFAQSLGAGAGDAGSGDGVYATGGNGGNQSHGNRVEVTNSGTIVTRGLNSYGIYAQSVGGGGGDGGRAAGLFAVGGRAGSGGSAQGVDVANSGSITTEQEGSVAIFAQSVGGGGGNGGSAFAGGASGAFAIGGAGGLGGSAGNVSVNALSGSQTVADLTASTIATTGSRAHGIQAQSVGGGGGNGGFSMAGSYGSGLSFSVALGGSGAQGGSAGNVSVNEKGKITTVGDLAYGILAQSVGGGGGNGGGSVSGAFSEGYSIAVTLAGNGGKGGDAGTVDVNLLGGISTTGALSYGIFAQSVGGGGGNGGFAVSASAGALAGSVALGGTGAGAHDGKAVTVKTAALDSGRDTIHTKGSSAHAIFAQSVGGGGGNGGFAVSAAGGLGSLGVTLGGAGDGGGAGGLVTIDNGTAIRTEGAQAYGVFGQSVGGGGGSGGFAAGLTAGIMSASVAVGGEGGQGGNAGNVSIDNSGNVTTDGDLSYGIFGQSVGGSGGDGGSTIAATITVSVEAVPAVGAAVAIGGKGGAASLGGRVDVDNKGSISTGTKVIPTDETDPIIRTGNGAHAIFAQSVGGSGGTGGFAGSGSLALGSGAAFGIAVGGRGGTGGHAGIVDVASTGARIDTWGDGANGIHAQSIGGGGGDGGFGLALSAAVGGSANLAASVAIGGRGDAGGTGNTVDVANKSAITTDGENSIGILAQSVGGGGGSGGFAATGTLALSENAAAASVSIGGTGGSGNSSKKVTVDNEGAITTFGKDSVGILAQSIGGGGGNGGLSITGQFAYGSANSGRVGVSLGGSGGDAGFAGDVEVNNLLNGNITTFGYSAHGIEAQSIGGGGGRGGLSVYGAAAAAGSGKSVTIGASVGGDGGTGGYGGAIDVTNNAAIRVYGDAAIGIMAQSVGGGGGDAGSSFTGILALANVAQPDSTTINLAASVGGKGGSGNEGGTVLVTNDGTIETGQRVMTSDGLVVSGVGGYGIFAQSVGGGGGLGGRANTVNIIAGPKCPTEKCPPGTSDKNGSKSNNAKLSATVGGDGGEADDAKSVTVRNNGTIITLGDVADGIFAQSVGGGGGVGGNGIAGTGEVSPVPVEQFFRPFGQVSQHKDIDVTVGGAGGASGNGALVDVLNTRNITTYGEASNGIFAQSVGGGGGVAGSATIGLTGKVGVGGRGSGGGTGGEVLVTTNAGAVIETFGDASNGIFAQSVGGGGGMAGNVKRVLANGLTTPLGHLPVNLGLGLAFGQSAGDGGDGGDVTVNVVGQIKTHGDSAAGIFAQSVGGGGGVQGELGNDLPVLSLLNWQIGSNGDAGKAGAIDIDVAGDIFTAGNSATGIFAQSQGGQDEGDTVDILVKGRVVTAALLGVEDGTIDDPLRGLGSVGIMAHSSGHGGNGVIEITIDDADGLVSGGRSLVVRDAPDDYAAYVGIGIWVVDGGENLVTNRGTIRTADGVDDGFAIYASGSDLDNADVAKRQLGGAETVDNYGRIIGSIDLGIGNNDFTNHAGAIFDTGKLANVGVGRTLANDGRVNPGGVGRVFTTTLNGAYDQGSTGVYGVDLDLALTGEAGEADRLESDGQMRFDGSVDLNIFNAGHVRPGEHSVVIAQSAATVLDLDVELLHPASVVSTFSTTVAETNKLMLNYNIDFAIVGLNDNQDALGEYINSIQLAGGSDDLLPVIDALFFTPDEVTYAEALDEMLSQPYLANEVALLMASLDFENSLMSCRVGTGEHRIAAEGRCAWGAVSQRRAERAGNADYLSYEHAATTMAFGAQDAIAENIYAGFGLGYDLASGETATSVSTGHRVHLGATLKHTMGNTVIAGAVTGGLGIYEVDRVVSLPNNGPSYLLETSQNLAYAAAHGRVSHVIPAGDAYIKPLVDVGITGIAYADYAETGGPVALEIAGRTEWFVSVAPALEIGGEFAAGDSVVRPFARAGMGVSLGDVPGMTASFVGAPDSAGDFTTIETIDQVVYDLAFGFDLVKHNGFNVRVTGEARVGETLSGYGAQLKVGAPF